MVMYILAVLPAFASSLVVIVTHCLPPSWHGAATESETEKRLMVHNMDAKMEERKTRIQWTVEESETYQVTMI
jgi:hypothetical protein